MEIIVIILVGTGNGFSMNIESGWLQEVRSMFEFNHVSWK